jgi:hypothetical protein
VTFSDEQLFPPIPLMDVHHHLVPAELTRSGDLAAEVAAGHCAELTGSSYGHGCSLKRTVPQMRMPFVGTRAP